MKEKKDKNIKLIVFIIFLLIIILSISVIGVYKYKDYTEIKAKFETKKAVNDELKKEIENLKMDIEELEKYREQSYYMNKHVAICTEETKLYHAYGCKDINDSKKIYIFNNETAKEKGYNAHSCVKDAPTSKAEDFVNQVVDGTYKERNPVLDY